MRVNEVLIESQTFLIERNAMKPDDWSKIGLKPVKNKRTGKILIDPKTKKPITTPIRKYSDPFLESIMKGVIFSFQSAKEQIPRLGKSITEVDKEFLGKILQPKILKDNMTEILSIKDETKRENMLKNLFFSVSVYEGEDEESLEPTGVVISGVKLSNIFKDEKIKGGLNPNLGNFSEALLGCAVAAKFAKQGEEITIDNLIDLGLLLKENNGIANLTAGKDKLEFKVSIPYMDEKAFYTWIDGGKDIEERKKILLENSVTNKIIDTIEKRANYAIQYANTSKRVTSAIGIAQADKRRNKVDVISDGGEKANQSSTKVDLKIVIDGKETAKRLLSIKAGNVAQFGQIAGVNFEHAFDFFKSSTGVILDDSIRKKFHNIPRNAKKADVAHLKKENFVKGSSAAYRYAYNELKQRAAVANQDPIVKGKLVKEIYNGLLFHLTRNEPGVEMVILDPGGKKAFSELSFGKEFLKALKQLDIRVKLSTSGYTISVYGFPIGTVAKNYIAQDHVDSHNKLVDLTGQLKDGTIRNMLGMGGLLKVIANIENYQKQHPAEPAPQAKTNKKLPMAPVQTPVTKNVIPAKTPAAMQPIKSIGSTSAADKAAKDKAIKDKMKAALAGGSKTPLEKKGR